jgi:THAP4-like, heme-binding beta-barrel domain
MDSAHDSGLPHSGLPHSGPPHSGPEPHPAIAPLSFLLGRWEGAGVLGYPTIESANYGEEISFSHNGKPFLIYSSRTWLLEQDGTVGRLSHMEVGFWRPQPDNILEVLITHPTGITEVYVGTISGTKIEMATDAVVRTATAKEVTACKRLYGLVGGDLAYAFDMAAAGQRLQPHLSAQLKRVGAVAAAG